AAPRAARPPALPAPTPTAAATPTPPARRATSAATAGGAPAVLAAPATASSRPVSAAAAPDAHPSRPLCKDAARGWAGRRFLWVGGAALPTLPASGRFRWAPLSPARRSGGPRPRSRCRRGGDGALPAGAAALLRRACVECAHALARRFTAFRRSS